LNTDYFDFIKEHPNIAEKTVFTGMLDEFFDYSLDYLQWRRVRFETEELPRTIIRGPGALYLHYIGECIS
jgi:UDP-galactopyranose mutase